MPGDEGFRASFKFPRHGWDQRLADFNRFLHIKTWGYYTYLVLYLLDKIGSLINNPRSREAIFRWIQKNLNQGIIGN